MDSTCQWIQHVNGFNMSMDSTCSASPKAVLRDHSQSTSRQGEEKQSAQQQSNKEFTGESCQWCYLEKVCTTAVHVHDSCQWCCWEKVCLQVSQVNYCRKGLHNSHPTRSLQVIHVNGATTGLHNSQGYRWFMLMVLLQKRSAQQPSNKEFTGDSWCYYRKAVQQGWFTGLVSQVIHVNGATAQQKRWFMLMVLLQKRSAQQPSNKEFTGDSC